jgi:hypothetical protein
MGLPKSVSFTPVARHNARAPAILRPSVVVAERNLGMRFTPAFLELNADVVFKATSAQSY